MHFLATRVPWLLQLLYDRAERGEVLTCLVHKLCHLAQRRLLARIGQSDIIVSLFPFATQAIGDLKKEGPLHATIASLMLDPAAHRLWVHPQIDMHVTVDNETAAEATARYGVRSRILGPLVAPQFRSWPAVARETVRTALLDEGSDFLVLISIGSLGIGMQRTCISAVRIAGGTPIVLCGRNDRLRRRLTGQRVRALGWTDDMATLMGGADALIQNAGGLTYREARAVALPVLTFAPIAGHGVANANVLHDAGLAFLAKSERELVEELQRLATRSSLQSMDRRSAFDRAQADLVGPDKVGILVESLVKGEALHD